MAQIFNITDDSVVISKLSLGILEGDVTHTGKLTIHDQTTVQHDLLVGGTITVDTLNVKNIITDSPSSETGYWVSNVESELAGKGFRWSWGNGDTQFIYRPGNRLWTNANIDLHVESSYNIDNVPVLSVSTLGPTVTKSNLRQVGPLNSLNVVGDTSIGEFAFFNTVYNRFGIGTDEPNAAISIIENDVEIAIGSNKIGEASIGTHSCHDFSLISDNIPRVTIKNNGEIHISDEVSKSGILRVFGSIYADTIVSDTRIERTTPVEFKATRDSTIFGKGLVWSGTGVTRQLILCPNPDRLWCSESIDIGIDQAYHVNGTAVLNEISLGKSVIYSSLVRVGSLESLTVNGETKLLSSLTVAGSVKTDNLIINAGISSTEFNSTGVHGSKSISISSQGLESFYADNDEIVIGHKQATRRPVKIFGQLSVGVNNPDPAISLAVSGNISFADKKFITGLNPPTEGLYKKGDICWNQNPQADSYIGWVCIVDGSPGMWAPFGAISRQ